MLDRVLDFVHDEILLARDVDVALVECRAHPVALVVCRPDAFIFQKAGNRTIVVITAFAEASPSVALDLHRFAQTHLAVLDVSVGNGNDVLFVGRVPGFLDVRWVASVKCATFAIVFVHHEVAVWISQTFPQALFRLRVLPQVPPARIVGETRATLPFRFVHVCELQL
jgi:hypothetical protein